MWRTHVWNARTREDFEDAVQDALLCAWERRHCAHITDFPGYLSAVIREKLRKHSWRRAAGRGRVQHDPPVRMR